MVLTALSASVHALADTHTSSQPDLAAAAGRYCIEPDGDHRLTWSLAERDGFMLLQEEDFPNLRLPGVEDATVRAFRLYQGQKELRIVTAATWLMAPGQGKTFYRWCWVSSSSDQLDNVVHTFQRDHSNRGFRSERVRLFAWIPRPTGQNEYIIRRRYLREHNILAREQGMRQIMVRQIGNGVSIGYGSPRDETTYRQFDYAGPEPLQAPE